MPGPCRAIVYSNSFVTFIVFLDLYIIFMFCAVLRTIDDQWPHDHTFFGHKSINNELWSIVCFEIGSLNFQWTLSTCLFVRPLLFRVRIRPFVCFVRSFVPFRSHQAKGRVRLARHPNVERYDKLFVWVAKIVWYTFGPLNHNRVIFFPSSKNTIVFFYYYFLCDLLFES